jgi:hypothetical protein
VELLHEEVRLGRRAQLPTKSHPACANAAVLVPCPDGLGTCVPCMHMHGVCDVRSE